MTPILVSDTNIWIDFQHASMLEALFQLPFEFVTTDFVVDELQEPDGSFLVGLGLKVMALDGAEVTALFGLSQVHGHSSLPDISCFYLASKLECPLLTGDGALRRLAKKEQVIVYGTMWLLDELVALGVITSTQAILGLEAMLSAGSRLPTDECNKRMKAWAGEDEL